MPDPASQSRSSDKRSSNALIALVRILARQAAREVLAETDPPAEANQDIPPEAPE
jgi:hypothetical protein